MRKFFILLSPLLLSGCLLATIFPNDYYKCASLSGWCKEKPERHNYGWNAGKSFYDPDTGAWIGRHDFLTQREIDMRTCGMDPVVGYSNDIEPGLCLEKKGWYLKGGPFCESRIRWDNPQCIKWRFKYSKPDVKPWG